MLETLKADSCKLGIVTSKMHDTIFEGSRIGCALELEKMEIGGLFSAVIGLEDVQKPKPDPECIHLALNKIGISPEHTLVAGDTIADIAAARAAGCKSCLAVWGIPGKTAPPKAKAADFIACEPHDIIKILKRYA